MTLVWILTTGNSDVAMISDKNWKDLQMKKKLPLIYNKFLRTELPKNKNEEKLFSFPARALGNLYGDVLDDERYFKILRFPLLEGFVDKLEHDNKNPDRIIVLLTDQEAIFDICDRNTIDSPYWKDTCTLKPILEHYLRQEFEFAKIEFATLQPEAGNNGLDDWDATLTLVKAGLAKWEENKWISKSDRVIVSHQAGTPAISSAVQFMSLSSFRGEVSFLLSNERSQEVNLVEYSSYFQSMEIEEAIKLLGNHDYAGVSSVLEERLKRLKADDSDDADKIIADKIIALLEVAKLWNLSKFDDEFKNMMESLPIDDLRETAKIRFDESWDWWIAYEEAYLAIARRKQGNIVEAFFHSFRAFEGIFAAWGRRLFNGYIDFDKDVPYLKADVLSDSQNYLSGSKLKELRDEISKNGGIDLELRTLCKIFKVRRADYKQKCVDLVAFWDNDKEKCISARRNFIFHQIQGISEDQLLRFWIVGSAVEWEDKILQFLNFIADEQDFKTWQEGSLMARVHQELVKVIKAIAI